MYRRFVFVALAVLLAYPIDNALAGHGSGSQSRTAHSSQHHAISPRHHASGSDGQQRKLPVAATTGQIRMAPSSNRGNTSVPFQTATQ